MDVTAKMSTRRNLKTKPRRILDYIMPWYSKAKVNALLDTNVYRRRKQYNSLFCLVRCPAVCRPQVACCLYFCQFPTVWQRHYATQRQLTFVLQYLGVSSLFCETAAACWGTSRNVSYAMLRHITRCYAAYLIVILILVRCVSGK